MRFFLLCGLLAAMATPAVAQTFEFDLTQQTTTALGTSFHFDKLVDARADRSTLGSVHRGMDNTPASANFRRGLEVELTPLLQQALPTGPATRPLVVRIHALSIYEIIRPTSETASAELVADFLEPVGADTYRLLLSTSELAESKGLDVTKQHDDNIKRLLEQSLRRLKNAPPASNAPVLTWAQVVAGEEGTPLRYPVQSGPLIRGVYRSFEEFRQNTPTLAEGPFEIKRKPRKGAQWAGTEEVEAWYLELDAYNPRRLVRGGAWGVSDGETAYVFYRGHYFPLQPAGNNYTFTGFKAHDPSAVAAGALLGGLAGAALMGATNSNDPQLYELRMTSGRVVTSMKQVVSANGFAAPDTAAIYLYRRQDAAPDQPLVVTLGGREVGTLASNSFLALSWRDRRQAMELCVRGGQPQCQSFVPDFTTATYFECSLPKGGSANPTVVKTSTKEGTFYVHRFRAR